MMIPRIVVTLFGILLPLIAIGQESQPFVIGQTVEFESEILEENRTLNIYLPPGYFLDANKEYPVIYLLDGSADEDFIHIVGLVQFGSFPWIEAIPETIVVGIANVDRRRDFTFPTKNEEDQKQFPTAGGSANFIQFLHQELIPFINKNYQVTNQKTLIGQSLGGLLASEVLLKHTDTFDNYIIVSPSLWWDDESLLGHAIPTLNEATSVYIAVGKEGEVMERVAKNLYDSLMKQNSSQTRQFFHFFEERDHGDALHFAVYDAFEKIFKQ